MVQAARVRAQRQSLDDESWKKSAALENTAARAARGAALANYGGYQRGRADARNCAAPGPDDRRRLRARRTFSKTPVAFVVRGARDRRGTPARSRTGLAAGCDAWARVCLSARVG